MIPKTISASAILTYEGCDARFYAEYVKRAQDSSNSSADLGTVCHAVLERWVKDGYHDPRAKIKFNKMQAIFVEEYFKLFSETDRYEEGLEMLERWFNRQDFWDRKVLSTEQKLNFKIPVTHRDGKPGEVQFTYIMDRFDMRDDGIPEVVDYKSIRESVQPEELKHKIQPRAYAVAAQLMYPEAEKIWVSYDLLRYDKVGVVFTKAENRLTYRHLQSVAQDIINNEPENEDDKEWPKEKINAECKYCIRKAECKTLLSHTEVGGLAGVNLSEKPELIGKIVDLRSTAKWQIDALKTLQEELDGVLTDYMVEEEIQELPGDYTSVKVQSRNTRKPEGTLIHQVVGDAIWGDYAKIGVAEADLILADPRLTDEQKSQIKKYIKKIPGGRFLKSVPRSNFEENV